MPQWKFVKRSPKGCAVLVTEYSVKDSEAPTVLGSLQKIDDLAIRKGYTWEKVEAKVKVPFKPEFQSTKEWTGNLMSSSTKRRKK